MQEDFNNLAEFIKKTHPNKFVYFPNPGNRGDELIYYATKKFFEFYNISYIPVAKKFPESKRLPFLLIKLIFLRFKSKGLVYGGGGGFSNDFKHSNYLILFAYLLRYQITVLPSSYEITPLLKNKVNYFARDKFDSLNKLDNKLFCHDMAFCLSLVPNDLIIRSEKGKGTANCFRTDKESRDLSKIPEDNYDLSLEAKSLEEMRDYILRHEIIKTDRLHVGILGVLLNKSTEIYENRYFKNKNIYTNSFDKFYHSASFETPYNNNSSPKSVGKIRL